MKKVFFLSFFVLLFAACKNEQKSIVSADKIEISSSIETQVYHAKAFDIKLFDGYKELHLYNIWPNSDISFKYLIIEDKTKAPSSTKDYDHVIELPLKTLVVTSTTHIPSLESLGALDKLIGFPNLDFISSPEVRKYIENGKLIDLGQNENISIEKVIDLNPDVFIAFTLEAIDSKIKTIEKAGIPVVYNSDWIEATALGKAEWIKFFGVLLGKYEESVKLFEEVEKEYIKVREIAKQANKKPKVFNGAMYRDIWYASEGDSWAAKLIEDAQGDYLLKDSKGTGSAALGLETVIETALDTEIWLDPSAFASLEELAATNKAYTEFEAYKNGEVYSYALNKGETGGVIYFELGPNRPDLILKDLVKILHPELLPEHKLYFYTKLN